MLAAYTDNQLLRLWHYYLAINDDEAAAIAERLRVIRWYRHLARIGRELREAV